MSDKNSKQFDPRNRQILFDFWEDLPERKIIVDYEDTFFSHIARRWIIGILGQGIKEEINRADETRVIRRALNVQEIYQRIQEMKKERIKELERKGKTFELSLHSLYFHIQKLEEAGFIRIIAILREGRHNVTYYGRTARVLLFKEDYEEDEAIKNAFLAMMKFGPFFNPKIKSDEVMSLYEELIAINKESIDFLQRKLGQYEDILDESGIDPNDLQRFFVLLNSINPKYIALFTKIVEYFELDLWE